MHVPSHQFAAGGPLEGKFSLPGTTPGDDNAGENGLDNPAPEINGISSGIVVLLEGTAPTALSGETGLGSTDDDAQDASQRFNH